MANFLPIYWKMCIKFKLQELLDLTHWKPSDAIQSWLINHLPPACWLTFWKSTFKQQLGCRFDIMDSISSLFFCILTYAIIYVLINHIIFRLYLYYLNIVLYFFKYSCTNIFHRCSLYTFYDLGQHMFKWWFVAWQHQAITWTKTIECEIWWKVCYIHLHNYIMLHNYITLSSSFSARTEKEIAGHQNTTSFGIFFYKHP